VPPATADQLAHARRARFARLLPGYRAGLRAALRGVDGDGSGDTGAASGSGSSDLLPTVLASLAMRDLTLVESLMRLIEDAESREEDTNRLEFLYRIDNLVTRMRRYGENLLVLVGQDAGDTRVRPVDMLDVVRAAISETRDYARVRVNRMPEVQVNAVAADDVSHLIAELLDNATSKSPHHTEVVISARALSGAVTLVVEDRGIGIPPDRLADLNARLVGEPRLDVSVTRHMGLYVVSRLAHRHGVSVRLNARPGGGISAVARLPAPLLHLRQLTAGAPPAPPEEPRRRTASGLPTRERGAGRERGPQTNPLATPMPPPTVPAAPIPPTMPAPHTAPPAVPVAPMPPDVAAQDGRLPAGLSTARPSGAPLAGAGPSASPRPVETTATGLPRRVGRGQRQQPGDAASDANAADAGASAQVRSFYEDIDAFASGTEAAVADARSTALRHVNGERDESILPDGVDTT
jgi:anti-sigma regulatory factor (Ser/Thr protein kinase)